MNRKTLLVLSMTLVTTICALSCRAENEDSQPTSVSEFVEKPGNIAPAELSGDGNYSDCGFGAIPFTADLNDFSRRIKNSDWHYNHAQKSDLLTSYDKCAESKKQDGFDKTSYISECFFRSTQDRHFNGMGVHARNRSIYRIRLHFRNDQGHLKTFQALKHRYGSPSRTGGYFEERFKHNLAEWRKESCRVIYDYGGIDTQKPVYLFLESLPVFKAGFNPPHVNLDFLGVER